MGYECVTKWSAKDIQEKRYTSYKGCTIPVGSIGGWWIVEPFR
jgi:hypothetical protein